MKAYLVIDMPVECPECPLCEHRNVYCLPVKRDVDDFENGRPSWCPLKPLPRKINTDFCANIVYANGWNACLDEITGETE